MLKCDEVVIGEGLNAAVYAYSNNATLVRIQGLGPAPFDFFDPGDDLSRFPIEAGTYELSSNIGAKRVGVAKLDLWERLSFILSTSGNIPMSDKIKSIRVDPDNKTLSAFGSGATKLELNYNKLRVFDDAELHGIDSGSPPASSYKVLDWFSVRSGCRHELDHIFTGDDLVREVFFYPSERVDGNHDLKDAVAVSYMTKKQLYEVEYSDTYARLKLQKLMKENGIRGTRNGRDPRYPGKYKYYAIRVESAIRDVYPVRDIGFSCDGDITFDNRSVEHMLNLDSVDNKSYSQRFGWRLSARTETHQ